MLKKLTNKLGDKLMHNIFGALITIISGLLLYKFVDTKLMFYPIFGLIVGNIFGLAKEFIYDKWMKKGTFSGADMLATLWGTIVGGAAVIMTIGTLENWGTN